MRRLGELVVAAYMLGSLGLGGCNGCGDDPMADGGMDASDSSADEGPVCIEDSDCSDGLFCNGEETCSAEGACVSGEDIACDDGIECTIDRCSESSDACVSEAPDEDGDGTGAATCLDDDGMPLGSDCDDTDPLRFPGNREVCDEDDRDEDCDLTTFGRVDLDADGEFDAQCVNVDEDGEIVSQGQDCDDLRDDVNTRATEVCDGLDNNCDGRFDEELLISGYEDMDRDGFGNADSDLREACPGTVGFAPADAPADCDDVNRARNPGQVEVCDMQDNDCDDEVDEDAVSVPWYLDDDGDGFGDPDDAFISCVPPAGRVLSDGDCDDGDAARNPGAAERCNAVDDDCNGEADFEVSPGDFEDDDGDGLPDISCGEPLGLDCDDRNPLSGPGGVESCDGRDNDCDGDIDEDVRETLWSYDADGDGFGGTGNPSFPSVVSCAAPAGYVANGEDCDDLNARRNPSATEVCDGADQDCDARIDEDGDCGCPPGRADCDGDASNGCEVRTGNDMANCGGCGNTCSAGTNVRMAVCLSGQCIATECDDGFEDCDADNGTCETNTDTSLSDCGACGRSCSVSDLTVTGIACEFGSCRIATCAPGRRDCNGNNSDGCETDLSSPLSCGECGNGCGGSECIPDGDGGFECDFGPLSCPPAFADCDGDAENGCERAVTATECGCVTTVDCTTRFGPGVLAQCVGRDGDAFCEDLGCMGELRSCGGRCIDVSADPLNCGECGRDCGGGTCSDGACVCDRAGLSECDGTCVNTERDSFNCGDCGRACDPGDRCVGGTCQLDCPPGFTDCSGTCIDIQTDVGNCGACDNVCEFEAIGTIGPVCDSGECRFECFSDRLDCSTESGCESEISAPASCGSCLNNCGAGGACIDPFGGLCDSYLGVAVGSEHGCYVRQSGGVACWGRTADGRLGTTAPAGSTSGDPLEGDEAIQGAVQVAVGSRHSCAVLNQGPFWDVVCWGDNSRGQLGCQGGDFCPVQSTTPVNVEIGSGGGSIQSIEIQAGFDHTCALIDFSEGLEVRCWGDNQFGQIGSNNAAAFVGAPESVVFDFGEGFDIIFATSMAIGGNFGCATEDFGSADQLVCWGSDAHGQLADGTVSTSSPFAVDSVPFPDDIVQVDAGASHACALLTSGDFVCWGEDDASGSLGMTPGNNAVPVVVPFTGEISDFFMANQRSCVQRLDGRLFCRGNNENEELIDGVTSTPVGDWSSVPGTGFSLSRFSKSAIARTHCGLSETDEIFCWGDNREQELGRGEGTPVTTVSFGRVAPGTGSTSGMAPG